MDFALYRSGESHAWPYLDLELHSPACPLCGSASLLLVATNVHPQAFCTEDTCEAFTWDPTVPTAELLIHALNVAARRWLSEPGDGA